MKPALKVLAVLGVLLFFLLIVGAVTGQFGGSGSLGGVSGAEKFNVLCDVTVKNSLLRDASISGASCSVEKAGLCFGFSVMPLSVAKDDLDLRLSAGGKTATSSFSLYETQDVTRSLMVKCVDGGAQDVRIKLYEGSNMVSEFSTRVGD